MASKYLQKFPVPQEFPNILHDYARQVLRNQPEDIIEFSIGYFTALETGQEFDYPRKGEKIPPPKNARPQYDDEEDEDEGRRQVPQSGSRREEMEGSPEVRSYVEQVFNSAQQYRKTPSIHKMSQQQLDAQQI